MIIRPNSDLREKIENAEVFLFGDVRNVVYSQAKHVMALPNLAHGLGVCGEEDPTTIGEGIVVRRRAARTSPDTDAGTKVDYQISSKGLYSPFLVGWNAEPSFTTQFISESGISLNQVYQAIFLELRERKLLQDHTYVFVEMLGSFKPKDIFDRALQLPIDRGHVLITSAEHSARFFKAKIIYNDLINHGARLDSLIPLCVIGMAHLSDSSVQAVPGLNERVFYVPPRSGRQSSFAGLANKFGTQVLSHNHALGWRREQLLNGSAIAQFPCDSSFLDELLECQPDYIVHLDDWSIVSSASVNVYLAQKDRFSIRET